MAFALKGMVWIGGRLMLLHLCRIIPLVLLISGMPRICRIGYVEKYLSCGDFYTYINVEKYTFVALFRSLQAPAPCEPLKD